MDCLGSCDWGLTVGPPISLISDGANGPYSVQIIVSTGDGSTQGTVLVDLPDADDPLTTPMPMSTVTAGVWRKDISCLTFMPDQFHFNLAQSSGNGDLKFLSVSYCCMSDYEDPCGE